MDVTIETVAPREVEFTVRPEPAQVDEARRQAARRFAARVRIPGFRPGKAPYALVERTVGRDTLTEEAAEILAPELYKRVLEEGGHQPYDRPTLRIVQREPLELKLRVALEPSVELGDYRQMRVEPEPPVQVTPEQEEQLLNELREQHGVWTPVERPAQLGDRAVLDIQGVALGRTVVDQTGSELNLTENLTPPGFAQAIVGMEPGQTREFSLRYPDDAPEEMAGKVVSFTVTLRELKERRLPTLDDEFARSLGEAATLDELRANLRERLRARLEAEARERLGMRVLDELVARSRLDYPNLAVERQIDRTLEQRDRQLRRQGFTLESYLHATHKSLAQYRDELRSEAELTLQRSLVLRELARVEEIRVDSAEIKAQVDRVAEAYGDQADAVRRALVQEQALASVAAELYGQKALSRLIDLVTGKVEEGAPAAREPEAPEAGGEAHTPATEE
mgnify:CR=1 FL=1